ncbi:citrate synthase [Halodesulfurarchaeum sp. HSR-GB]|uniref:citrate synthase n=1 Tax=Halodesulfurarchaeum sp. HSR-GB TaxID=3074077 RepID=UPI002863EB7A|nr:citrate synthase [Halodesulfurarchaeum sp. HSR-GB]MDR5656334.1 citrate synthase [Halodesulfurarchaeum sp. HSR-GB]
MTTELKKGLEGVLVAESALSDIDGDAGKLYYRGYPIEALAEEATYEEVLYLLWNEDLPTATELADFEAEMREARAVKPGIIDLLQLLADSGERPISALRSSVSMLSAEDPATGSDPTDLEAARHMGRRISAKFPTVLAAFDRLRRGKEPVEPREDLGLAANFLYMLHGTEPDPVDAEIFDKALTLHADHGLNASTFTAMVVGSTLADVYNSVTAAVAALSGPLHGGANQDVMEALLEIDEGPLTATEWIKELLDSGERIPGWGHRVYNVRDPRAKILESELRRLSNRTEDCHWLEYLEDLETHLTEEVGLPEKGVAPNVDFYSGAIYYQLGIPLDMFTAIFAMSRSTGWIGHVLEYQEDNKLIRPRGRYIGPDRREFVPIEER